MIKFILDNKEWLFSGVGVTVIIALYAIFRKVLFVKKENHEEEISKNITVYLNASNPATTNQKENDDNIIPIEKISTLSFTRIGEIINAAPPLQRNEIKKNFVGIKVSWDAYLKSASKDDEGIVNLRFSPGPIDSHRLYTISCKVAIDDYRELSILPEGAHLRIEGVISAADNYDVDLSNVKLYFFEKY